MPNYEKSLTRDSAISIAERLADDTAFEVALQKEAEQLRSIGEVEAADCIGGEIAFFQRGRELAKIGPIFDCTRK